MFNHIISDFIQLIVSGRNIQQAGARPAEWLVVDHILIIRLSLSEAAAYGCVISLGSDWASKLVTMMIPKSQADSEAGGNNIN